MLKKIIAYLRPKRIFIISGEYYKDIDDLEQITLEYDIGYVMTHWKQMLKYHSLYYFIWTRFVERNKYLSL